MVKRYLESAWIPFVFSWAFCWSGFLLARVVHGLLIPVVILGGLSCLGIGAAAFFQLKRRQWFKGSVSSGLFLLTLIPFLVPLVLLVSYWVTGGSFLTASLEPGAMVQPARQSADDFLEGKVPLSEVTDITLVKLPSAEGTSRFTAYHWFYEFPGFAKVSLNGDGRKQLVAAVRSCGPFVSTDRLEVERAAKEGKLSPAELAGLAARSEQTTRHEFTVGLARAFDRVGGLVVKTRFGKPAFLYVWLADGKAYLEAAGERASLRAVSEEAYPALERAFAEAAPGPVEILFPRKSAEEANRTVEKKFNRIWKESEEYVRGADETAAVFGTVLEVRPAKGPNFIFTWMDQAAQFTFRVRGDRGEGVVTVWREGSPNNYISGELITGGQFLELKKKDLPWS